MGLLGGEVGLKKTYKKMTPGELEKHRRVKALGKVIIDHSEKWQLEKKEMVE